MESQSSEKIVIAVRWLSRVKVIVSIFDDYMVWMLPNAYTFTW